MEDENQIRVLMSISHLQGCSTYWPEYEWFFSTFHDSFNFLVCLLFFLVSNIIAVKEKEKNLSLLHGNEHVASKYFKGYNGYIPFC